MNLLYVLDYRYFRTPDGRIWTASMYAADFWERYLNVFDHAHIISRAMDVAEVEAGWQRVDSADVTVHVIPFYQGPLQYLARRGAIRQAMEHALDREGAVILRIPSQLATCAESILSSAKRPFAVEVVGDPWQSLSRGAVRHRLRPLFRRYFTRNQKRQCDQALAASYVAGYLQRSYPPGPNAFHFICSDVYLPGEAFAPAFAPIGENRRSLAPPTLVTIASLDQAYKGIDILLEAVSVCRARGLELRLRIVGSGRYEADLQARAARQDLAGHVEFLGQLPSGEAVREVLRSATLFVLPSRTEGMPRALLEAMALGLPCLGAQVGGIPEVLSPEDTVPPNDVAALAAKLADVLGAGERLSAMSKRNSHTALGFAERNLHLQRNSFYQVVKDSSAPTADGGKNNLPRWKRCLDVIGAVSIGLAALPVWLGAAAVVRLHMGTPVLFAQPRVGRANRMFRMYKFRTMKNSVDLNGKPLADAERLTRLGRWLRRFSIDELPQLWNVLQGEMSLVGPRPLLQEYLPYYTDLQRRRHEVNPGLTGWAQIHGRNGLPWPKRFELDVWYVDHQSLAGDLKILFASIGTVLRGNGVSLPGHATMTAFEGTAFEGAPFEGLSGNGVAEN